jgi:hypothetical protein
MWGLNATQKGSADPPGGGNHWRIRESAAIAGENTIFRVNGGGFYCQPSLALQQDNLTASVHRRGLELEMSC